MTCGELSAASLVKLVSFLFWNWMYFITVEHSPGKSPEWCSRAVTLLHGSFATFGGLSQCKWRYLKPSNLPRRILPCQYMLMVWSWGYFAFDLLWCLLYWTDSVVMLCHHTSALFAITRYMQKDHTGCTFACTLVLLEITNPLLQTRWFLKQAGYGKTNLYFIVEMLYLIMFLALRGVLGTYLMYYIFTKDFFDLEEKMFCLIFYIVSMIFIYDILGYVRYRYKQEIIDWHKKFYYATCLPDDAKERELLQAQLEAQLAQNNTCGITRYLRELYHL